MKVIIAGESPLVTEITQFCMQAGHDTHMFLVEDFLSAVQSGYVLDEARDADVVIELHNESAAAKHELLLALGNVISPNTLVLSSALATSATQAAAWMTAPERVVGFGVVPPVAQTGIIEIAAARQTAPEAMQWAARFWQGLGFEVATVGDAPGLVRMRVIACLVNEAASAVMEGVATPADIDQAMKLGTNYPFGPLTWGDLIGLDTVLGVLNGLFGEYGEDRYRPCPLLRRMVTAGETGQKSGKGFFNYAG
jgi:3-hydroxybutyryl-CoA dehydrogenase